MSDSSGKILFIDSTNIGTILQQKKINENDIIIIELTDDGSMSISHIDSVGNALSNQKFSMAPNRGIYGATFNYNNSEIFISSSDQSKSYVTRYNLKGAIIKDTSYLLISPKSSYYLNNIPTFWNYNFYSPPIGFSNITPLKNNAYLVSGSFRIILDSNLRIVWSDTISKFSKNIYNSILTSDSFIVSIGTGNYVSVGTAGAVSDVWLGIKSYNKRYVKSIAINGPAAITQSSGSIALSAIVLPQDVSNPAVNWSVNDTTTASITQAGMLRAKKNGNVIVTAATTDGTQLQAVKSILITNQGLGLRDAVSNNEKFEVYPNPASDEVNIKFTSTILPCFDFYDCLGNEIKNIEIYTNDLENYLLKTHNLSGGFYLLKVTYQSGRCYHKRILILK
ncbi:MAG: Ig-like domain-containing protein [Bacteroidia bacterium]|nr:Ig-like domain-containing protein [Bacteroidia bacterium]